MLFFQSINSHVVIPSPQAMQTNTEKQTLTTSLDSIRRVEGEPVELSCVIKPDVGQAMDLNKILWEYSEDGQAYALVQNPEVTVQGDKLSITSVKKTDRGFYRCTMNNVEFTVQLRIKGKKTTSSTIKNIFLFNFFLTFI